MGESGKTIRVAALSNRNVPGDPERNLAAHLAWIARAARRGVRLLLFPELSLSGYSSDPFIARSAEDLDGRRCRKLLRAAREYDLFVAFGLPLRRRGGLFISHVLVGPNGRAGHYEKVHLAGVAGEKRVFRPGRRFRVFDVDGVRVGINICYDGRHPGSSLSVAHLGAEIILHPHGNFVGVNGRDPKDWAKRKQAYLGPRAADTGTYALICNSVGIVRDPSGKVRTFSGGALILGPGGMPLCKSTMTVRREHMLVADLDIAGLRRDRRTAVVTDRRPDAYIQARRRPGVDARLEGRQ